MLGIIEIILFVCGLLAVITGKVPSVVFGGKQRIEGNGARIVGAILLTPLPIAFAIGFVLALALGNDGRPIAVGIEIALLLICFLVARSVSRRVGQPA
jgi:hypothetical protein